MSSAKEEALALKEEGNEFFKSKNYQAAFDRYTSALRLDSSNAIYFSNRAAALQEMKRYNEAKEDATKAIELDHKSTKAYARLGSALFALKQYKESVTNYQKALDLLPKSNRSPSEVKQKTNYSDQIRRCDAYLSDAEIHLITKSDRKKTPHARAAAMIDELNAEGNFMSSAWVIHAAYESWCKGEKMVIETGQLTADSGNQPIEYLTNGFVLDERCAQFSSELHARLTVILNESAARSGVPPEVLLDQACSSVRRVGWNDAILSLSNAARTLLLRGLMSSLEGDQNTQHICYGRAMAIVEGGRKMWPDAPLDGPGSIFKDTFMRGLRRLWSMSYQKVCQISLMQGDLTTYPISRMMDFANAELRDMENSVRPEDPSPGFNLGFWEYCRANALAMKGWSHRRMARFEGGGSENKMNDDLFKSAEYYAQAANELPDDEETRYWLLNTAVSSAFRSGVPLGFALPLMEMMRKGIPKMKKLWEKSSLQMSGRDDAFQTYLLFEQEMRKQLRKGKVTEESVVKPVQDTGPNWM